MSATRSQARAAFDFVPREIGSREVRKGPLDARRQPRNKSDKWKGQELVVLIGGKGGLETTTANSWCGPFCTSGLWVRCHEKKRESGERAFEPGNEEWKHRRCFRVCLGKAKAPRLSTSSLPQLPLGAPPQLAWVRAGITCRLCDGDIITPLSGADDSDVMSFPAGRVIPAGAVAANPRIVIAAEDGQPTRLESTRRRGRSLVHVEDRRYKRAFATLVLHIYRYTHVRTP